VCWEIGGQSKSWNKVSSKILYPQSGKDTQLHLHRCMIRTNSTLCGQRRSQEFDLGGYKWVKGTKQPHKKFKVDWFGGIYTDIGYLPVATPLFAAAVKSFSQQTYVARCYLLLNALYLPTRHSNYVSSFPSNFWQSSPAIPRKKSSACTHSNASTSHPSPPVRQLFSYSFRIIPTLATQQEILAHSDTRKTSQIFF